MHVCIKTNNKEKRGENGMPSRCSLTIIPDDQFLCHCKGHKGNVLLLMETKFKDLTSLSSWNIAAVN